MRRREFITALGGAAAAWPLAARAQQQDRMRRIGVLSNLPENDPQMKARLSAFLQGLEKRGWSQGRNVQIERRFGATTADQLQAHAEELVALQPDVILANAPRVVAAAQRAGRQAIPIVFVAVSDPVGAGFVTSLARPSGNLTGLMNFEASITGKWLAMLKEIAPTLGRAGLVGNPRTTDFDYFLRAMRAAAPSLALEPASIDVETGTDIEREIELFARKPGGGLVLPPDATTISHSRLTSNLHPPAPVVQVGAVFNCRADGQTRSHPQAFPHSSDELSEGPYMQPMNLKALRAMRPCAAMPRRHFTRARPARTADANHQRQT